MRKVMLMVVALTLLPISCKYDIYVPHRSGVDICRVESTYYPTIQDAVDAIMDREETKAINGIRESHTIYLLENVTEDYALSKRSGFSVPTNYTNVIKMNFDGYEYFFSNNQKEDHFFSLEGGSNIEIVNGTSVILEDSAPDPAAIAVNTKVVTINNHVIDDRRKKPHAIEVKSEGVLVIEGESALNGDAVVEAGILSIDSGEFVIDELKMAKDAQVKIQGGEIVFADINGTGSVNMTDGDVVILDIDKSDNCEIEISGGKVSNPHHIDDKITDAITDPDNVEHEVIHDWVVVKETIIKEPTCTEEGLRYVEYRCETCLEILIVDEEVIPALGHDYKDWKTDTDYHWRECSRCHQIKDRDKHNRNRIVQDGNKGHHWECTVCGHRTETESHIWDEHDKYCIECGYLKPEEGGGGGGFVVDIKFKEPLGDLKSTKIEKMKYEVRYEGRKDHDMPTSFVWTVNGNERPETGDMITVVKDYDFTYQVSCAYRNDDGWGSSSIVI